MYLTEKARRILYSDEVKNMFREYYKLSGKGFPPFNYDEWESIDQWLSVLTSALEELREKQATE